MGDICAAYLFLNVNDTQHLVQIDTRVGEKLAHLEELQLVKLLDLFECLYIGMELGLLSIFHMGQAGHGYRSTLPA